MSKAPSPLLGFNNNVRHKGRVFHVQTEDSGVRHPHIITHLFMDGGRILKTTKTSYAEHLGAENLGEIVRRMMKEQHKSMFVALRDGAFDDLIVRHFGPISGEGDRPTPDPYSGPLSGDPMSLRTDSGEMAAVSVPPLPAQPPEPLPVEGVAAAPAAPAAAKAPERPAQVVIVPARPVPNVSPQAVTQPEFPASEPAVSVRPVVAVDSRPPARSAMQAASPLSPPESPRPAAEPRTASNPPQRPVSTPAPAEARALGGGFGAELPPPPANVLPTNRPEGNYRELNPEGGRSSGRLPAAKPRSPSGRHGVARPSTATGNRPPDNQSLFGDDLNEKSLDEVILSYLAEDLDAAPGKKK